MNIKLDINVCRVCLKTETINSIQFNSNIIEKFQYVTEIKILSDDGMPSCICDLCYTKLKVAYDFRRQCEASDRQLHDFIRRVANEFKEVASNVSTDAKEVMLLNDDEMQLLVNAGYKSDNSIDESQHSLMKIEHIDSQIEQALEQTMDQQMADSIESIEEEEYNMIQEDDCDDPFSEENSEEIHLEECEEGEGSIDSDDPEDLQGEENSDVTIITSNDFMEQEQSKQFDEQMEKPKMENRSNICIKCDKDFSTKTNLMRHMLTHDGVKPYQCSICGNGFTQNGSLKQHMLIHTGERPHKCNVCDRGFTQAKSLVFHMRRHTGEKPFACDQCGLTFRQKDGLKRHVLMKHSGTYNESNFHACSICQRVLRSKYSLNLHMKKHIGSSDNLFKCEICEKNFSSKSSLENHHRQHTGERPFKCDQCGREFSRKGSLITHAKMHLDTKPFVCHVCNKGFVQRHLFLSHVQIHKNQPAKAYQCGKCQKSFSIKRNLLQHLRNHNKDTLTIFKCDDCSIAFNTKRGLKLHRSNEHKETVSDLNECDICHIPFVSVTDLNHHINITHDSIDEKCELCDLHFTSKKLYEDHILEHELMNMNEQ